MRDLAERVVARERRYERAVSRVTVTAWRADFDRAALRASERPLRTFIYDVPKEVTGRKGCAGLGPRKS